MCFDFVSYPAKYLVERLLQVDPDQRLAAADILQQEWFTGDIETDSVMEAMARKVMVLKQLEIVAGKTEMVSGKSDSIMMTCEEDSVGCKRAVKEKFSSFTSLTAHKIFKWCRG